jgi:hypothetical protein
MESGRTGNQTIGFMGINDGVFAYGNANPKVFRFRK